MVVVIVEGEGAVLGVNLGRPVVTNGNFATQLFPARKTKNYRISETSSPILMKFVLLMRIGLPYSTGQKQTLNAIWQTAVVFEN